MFQGSSQNTARKEFEIQGVSRLRFTQFKNQHFQFNNVICADVFCGRGTNEVGGEIVEGSPIKLTKGFKNANNKKVRTRFWFSDIRKNACDALEKIIDKDIGADAIRIEPMDAKNAVNYLANVLHKVQDCYLILILDPNGPKDFPKEEVKDLISAFYKRIDIVPYISATSINRCVNARKKARRDFKGWLGEIENFDEGFVSCLTNKNRSGWIRTPIKGDPQYWTMIPTFGRFTPRNGWEKQGYYKINSEEGKQAIKFYCGGTE